MASGTIAPLVDFVFEGQTVRIVGDSEEPWFVLVDACRVLELANPSKTAQRLDKDELTNSYVTDSSGRSQEMLIVSEPGFYKLLATSQKPQAKRLDRLVRHEVLPSIRKHGCYPPPAANVIPPEMIAITQLFDQFDRRIDEKIEPLSIKLDEIDRNLRVVVDNTGKGRKEPTAETLRIQHKVVRDHWFCLCPCEKQCGIRIADENGFIKNAWHYHHQYGAWNNNVEAGIPLAAECHQRIHNDAAARLRFDQVAFPEFQNALARMQPKQISMLLKLPDSKD